MPHMYLNLVNEITSYIFLLNDRDTFAQFFLIFVTNIFNLSIHSENSLSFVLVT